MSLFSIEGINSLIGITSVTVSLPLTAIAITLLLEFTTGPPLLPPYI